MRYMASSQVLSGRCVPWSGVPEVTLNRYRQSRQLNCMGRVDSRRTSSPEHRRQRTPSGQRAASNQARHAASERNLSSRPGSVQSFMTTIYRTPPAHQNPVRQGNNSVGHYGSTSTQGRGPRDHAARRHQAARVPARSGDPEQPEAKQVSRSATRPPAVRRTGGGHGLDRTDRRHPARSCAQITAGGLGPRNGDLREDDGSPAPAQESGAAETGPPYDRRCPYPVEPAGRPDDEKIDTAALKSDHDVATWSDAVGGPE